MANGKQHKTFINVQTHGVFVHDVKGQGMEKENIFSLGFNSEEIFMQVHWSVGPTCEKTNPDKEP